MALLDLGWHRQTVRSVIELRLSVQMAPWLALASGLDRRDR